MKTIPSRTFEKIDVFEMGLKSFADSTDDFFGIGMTTAVLNRVGKVPSLRHWFTTAVNGTASSLLHALISLIGSSPGNEALDASSFKKAVWMVSASMTGISVMLGRSGSDVRPGYFVQIVESGR